MAATHPAGQTPRQTARASAERLFGANQPAAAGPSSAVPRSKEISLRGSLGHLPSAATDDEMKARRDAYERTLWQAHRGLVLRLDDPDLTGTHRLMIEALARARGFA